MTVLQNGHKKSDRGIFRGKRPEIDIEKALKPLRFKAFSLVEVTGREPVLFNRPAYASGRKAR